MSTFGFVPSVGKVYAASGSIYTVANNAGDPSFSLNWNDPTDFSPSRKIVRDSAGSIYAVYNSQGSGFSNIYLAKSINQGQTWTSQAVTTDTYNQQFPSIAIDSQDNIHVVWCGRTTDSPNNKQIRYREYTNGAWQPIVELTNSASYNQYDPALAIDSQDNIHVAWGGSGLNFFEVLRYQEYTNGAWQPIVNLTNEATYDQEYPQEIPSVAIDSQDNIHVVWKGVPVGAPSGHYQTRYLEYTNGSWQPIVELTTDTSKFQWYPSIAIDSHDNLHVVWNGTNASSPGIFQIRYREYTNGAWRPIVELTTNDGYDQESPSIAIDSHDNIHVVWNEKTADNYYFTNYSPYAQIRYREYTNGSWQPIENLTSSGNRQYFANLIWAEWPKVCNHSTNITEDGFFAIWTEAAGVAPNTVFNVKDFISSDLDWQTQSCPEPTPNTPTVNTPTTSSLKITLTSNASTDYAILNETANKYIKADGTMDDATPVWRTYTEWGGAAGIVNTGLSVNTSYIYKVKARNIDHVETALSGGTTQTTLAIYTLTYSAGSNGSIVGTSPQTVDYGASGTEVTATPASGYHFVSWSDNVLTAARTDVNITADITVTATFAATTTSSSKKKHITETIPVQTTVSNEIPTTEEIINEIVNTSRNYYVTPPVASFVVPSASFGTTADNLAGSKISFDATGSTSNKQVCCSVFHHNKEIVKYEWDFGDWEKAEGVKVEHQYKSPGRYTVTLTVTDSAGNKNTTTQTVDVKPVVPTITNITANGTALWIEGKADPNTTIYFTIHSNPFEGQGLANKDGYWTYYLDNASEVLGEGDHTIVALAAVKLADNTELKGVESKTYDFKMNVDDGKLKVETQKTRVWQIVSGIAGLLIIVLIFVLFLRKKR